MSGKGNNQCRNTEKQRRWQSEEEGQRGLKILLKGRFRHKPQMNERKPIPSLPYFFHLLSSPFSPYLPVRLMLIVPSFPFSYSLQFTPDISVLLMLTVSAFPFSYFLLVYPRYICPPYAHSVSFSLLLFPFSLPQIYLSSLCSQCQLFPSLISFQFTPDISVLLNYVVMATLAKRKRTKASIMVFSSISKRSEHLRQ